LNLDELIKLVSKKTGLSQEMSKTAVETVLNYLKQKLPAPIAAQVDGVLSGGGTPDMGDLAKGLGSMLGKK